MRKLGVHSYTRIVEDETGPATYWPTNAGLIALDGSAAVRFGTVDISPFAGVAGTFTPYLINLYDSSSELLSGYLADADGVEAYNTELVSGGDMEAGGGDPVIPTGWSNKNQDSGEASAMDTVDYHGGSASYDLNVDALDEGVNSNYFTTTAGKLYRFQAWIKRISGEIYAQMLDGADIVISHTTITSGYADWTVLTRYALATGSGAIGFCRFYTKSAGGRFKIDDVSIKEVTDLGTDGCHVVSARNGGTRNWASKSGSFDYNDSSGYTFDIVTT